MKSGKIFKKRRLSFRKMLVALLLAIAATSIGPAEASNVVVFFIMAIVLMIRPAGLFGKEK